MRILSFGGFYCQLLLAGWAWEKVLAVNSLLGGQFTTVNDVSGLLDLALDIADMKDEDDLDIKSTIYSEGRHATNGDTQAPLFSLADLSLKASETMGKSPWYNLYRHAFLLIGSDDEGETEGLFDTKPVEQYGDTIVNDLFDLSIENIETEAALIMNVWMASVHELFEALSFCKGNEPDRALLALDRSVAFWVGAGQEKGTSDNGHLLYNLAERAGSLFNQAQPDGQTKVNSELMGFFASAQTFFTEGSCGDVSAYKVIRQQTKRMVSLMTVPLVQMLIHHMMNVNNEDDGADLVELFALAVVPPVASCDPITYRTELNFDVLHDLTVEKQGDAIASLQRSYPCLGITCADVGTYESGLVQECSDDISIDLAGYSSSRSDAVQRSYMDRDIAQIGVFMKFGAFGDALDWYTYGWNSPGLTLEQFAKDQAITDTANAIYTMYQEYFGEAEFAHNMIVSSIEGSGVFAGASTEQQRLLVTGLLQYLVMFYASVSSIQNALHQCNQGNTDEALLHWDSAVAYFVGSREGSGVGGNDDAGILLYASAREFCSEFGSCVDNSEDGARVAMSNSNFIQKFKEGVAEISKGNCPAPPVKNYIFPDMQVPLVQGTLKYASLNAGLPAGSTSGGISLGFVFSRAILPLVDDADEDSSFTIDENMAFVTDEKPVPAGFAAVGNAFRNAIPEMDLDCSDIGAFAGEPQFGDMCGSPSPVAPTPAPVDPDATLPPAQQPTRAPIGGEHPTADTPADIAFGRYLFSNLNVAEGDASFAYDVRDMFNAASVDDASTIYEQGRDPTASLSGQLGAVSLAAFSKDASLSMVSDLMFNLFKYALYDDEDLADTSGTDFTYAHTVVHNALSNANDVKLASEAAVVMNVWMVIVHKLYESVRLCQGGSDARVAIDSAVALWIGREQAEGKFDHGWMMYAVGQSAAKYFGYPEMEAEVNTKLMTAFVQAQDLAGTCPTDGDIHLSLRFVTEEIIRLLTIPLIQSMMFHMIENNRNMVELYAASFIPQCSGCDPVAEEEVRQTLFEDFSRDTTLTSDFKNKLGSFMRCLRVTCDDLRVAENAADGLKDLVGDICTRLSSDGPTTMVGYTPTTEVTEFARMDLDILQIQILMRTKAYSTVSYLYHNGRNSLLDESQFKYRSLKSLALSDARNDIKLYDLFKDYYGTDEYAHGEIKNAYEQAGMYANSGRGALEQIVTRFLQGHVMYMAVFWNLEESLSACRTGDVQEATAKWDTAVAYYVGSIEGPSPGGQHNGAGEMLYSLANEMCAFFGECEGSGEAKINEYVMAKFLDGRDALKQSQCDQVHRWLTGDILPSVTLPLVQGSLYFAVENQAYDSVADSETVASGYALAKSVLPLVKEINETSATTIERNFPYSSKPVPDGAQAVYNAFTYTLRGMGLDCEDVGVPVDYPELDPCVVHTVDSDGDGVKDENPTEPIAPHQDTKTELGGGLYTTTTYVQDKANIALDVKAMNDGLRDGQTALPKIIYEQGQNSQQYDENGQFTSLRSLQKLSTIETNDMSDVPLFNFYKYALQDGSGNFMGRDVRLYADSLVESTFGISDQSLWSLPAEAAVILNLWMYVVAILEKTLAHCQNNQIRDEEGISSMDVAVAYWIGDGQVAGDANRGHLLYALTENMADLFGTAEAGQARANTNILTLFNEAKNELSLPNACSQSPVTYTRLRQINHELIAQMSVPIVQGLINSLRVNDINRIRIYAHAFVPLVAGCSRLTFDFLKEKLLGGTVDVAGVDEIIAQIRSTLPCLGITCADVGVLGSEKADECVDAGALAPLAGYKPTTDVSQYARLDLDISQMDILLQMNAFNPARDLYLYGKHASGKAANGGTLSLSHLATTSERTVVPFFDAFSRYFGTDVYADQIIQDALNLSESSLTSAQRREVVVRSSQTMVTYFAALQAIYEGVQECESSSAVESGGAAQLSGVNESWDKAAAILIGSLEGPNDGGSLDGKMMFDVAQQHCERFGRCKDQTTDSKVNEEMISLLYAGRGAVVGNNCKGLKKAADELASTLLVPLFQASLSSALDITTNPSAINRATASVAANSILPLVENSDRHSAEVVKKNLVLPGPSNTNHVARDVFKALSKVYDSLDVDCGMIGNAGGYDTCSGDKSSSGNRNMIIGVVVGVVVGLAAVLVACRLLRKKRDIKKELPENNPTFVTADGELNHSMDLLTKAFSSTPRTPSTRDEMQSLNDASPTIDDDFEESPALGTSGHADII